MIVSLPIGVAGAAGIKPQSRSGALRCGGAAVASDHLGRGARRGTVLEEADANEPQHGIGDRERSGQRRSRRPLKQAHVKKDLTFSEALGGARPVCYRDRL